jgi:hypothetical protein
MVRPMLMDQAGMKIGSLVPRSSGDFARSLRTFFMAERILP